MLDFGHLVGADRTAQSSKLRDGNSCPRLVLGMVCTFAHPRCNELARSAHENRMPKRVTSSRGSCLGVAPDARFASALAVSIRRF